MPPPHSVGTCAFLWPPFFFHSPPLTLLMHIPFRRGVPAAPTLRMCTLCALFNLCFALRFQVNKCLSIKGAEDTINKPFAFEVSTQTDSMFFIADNEKVRAVWGAVWGAVGVVGGG
jgi:hypothetical protein